MERKGAAIAADEGVKVSLGEGAGGVIKSA